MRMDGTLRERLRPRFPPVASPLARERLAEIAPAFPDGFLTPPLRALLLGLADHSEFLWQSVVRAPERFVALVEQAPEAAHADLVAGQRAAGASCASEADLAAIGKRFRANRIAHALLVALADLGGAWDLDAVTRALTEFADASVAAGLDALLRRAAAGGRVRLADPDDPARASGLFVLGLGKLGGGELNYSSDIDLVVFYDAARAEAVAGAEAKAVFGKVAQDLGKLLSQRTADGYVHRVDYRLRPDPGSTALALSTAYAFEYYQSIGQDWERAAFIKARAIAGDIEAGDAFLAELGPFIWRRHFDFAAIAEIHALKRQIHAVRGHDEIAVEGHDIKIGRGGIREIEFFAQTQQLVFGGRQPALRSRRTVETLGGLCAAGWIDARARDELTAAYTFLRTIEHRLQMLRDEQTQRLPSDPDALEGFARFCGFPTRAAFDETLLAHAARVQGHYALLFEGGAGEAAAPLAFGPGLDDAVSVELDWPARNALVVGATPNATVLAALQRHGLAACVTPVAQVESQLATVGPFTFLLLGADVFADDDGVERVRGWHRCSPSARIKIVARPGDLAPATLVRALRAGVNDVLDPGAPELVEEQITGGLRSAGAHRERVLAIGAHPDDVEIGCGGTLLDHRRRGDRLTILTLSRGAVGGDTAQRVDEARRTAEAIGAQLLFADLPDTRVDAGIDTIRLIESVVAAVDPTVVYVHSAHDNHQDHRAVHTAARSATRGVRRVFAYQSPSATNDFAPTEFVAVDSVVDQKVQVLQMFDSQNGRAYLEPELVTAGSRYWARHLGANARYAEPFEVIRSVGDLRHAVTTPAVSAPPVVVPPAVVDPATSAVAAAGVTS